MTRGFMIGLPRKILRLRLRMTRGFMIGLPRKILRLRSRMTPSACAQHIAIFYRIHSQIAIKTATIKQSKFLEKQSKGLVFVVLKVRFRLSCSHVKNGSVLSKLIICSQIIKNLRKSEKTNAIKKLFGSFSRKRTILINLL